MAQVNMQFTSPRWLVISQETKAKSKAKEQLDERKKERKERLHVTTSPVIVTGRNIRALERRPHGSFQLANVVPNHRP
jgi:hypothetical protein